MANTVEMTALEAVPEVCALLGITSLDQDTATALYERLVRIYTDGYVDGRDDGIIA